MVCKKVTRVTSLFTVVPALEVGPQPLTSERSWQMLPLHLEPEPSLGPRGLTSPFQESSPPRRAIGRIHSLSKHVTCLGLTTELTFYGGPAEGARARDKLYSGLF